MSYPQLYSFNGPALKMVQTAIVEIPPLVASVNQSQAEEISLIQERAARYS
jgi:hypothetical protein